MYIYIYAIFIFTKQQSYLLIITVVKNQPPAVKLTDVSVDCLTSLMETKQRGLSTKQLLLHESNQTFELIMLFYRILSSYKYGRNYIYWCQIL